MAASRSGLARRPGMPKAARPCSRTITRGVQACVLLLAFLPQPHVRAQMAEQDDPGYLTPPEAPPPSTPGYLGATLTTNSAGWRHVLETSDASGALVIGVIPASPAQAAGLAAGDVIVAIDDRPVRSEDEAQVLLRFTGEPVHRLTVAVPGGVVTTVEVAPGPRPAVADLIEAQVTADPSPANRLIYAQAGADPATALAILDDLVEEFPAFAEVHAARAGVLLGMGIARNDRSPELVSRIETAIDQAVTLDPASLTVRLSAARVLGTLGESERSENHALAAVAIEASSAEAHHLIGLVRLDQGEAEDALGALHRAVGLGPYTGQYYLALAECYEILGRADLARETQRALEELRSSPGSVMEGTAAGRPVSTTLATAAVLMAGAAIPLVRGRHKGSDVVASSVPRDGMRRVTVLLEWTAAVGLLSLAVPFLGRSLGLSAGASLATEVMDHVLPGTLIAIPCGAGIRKVMLRSPSQDFFFLMSLVIGLAGFWMASTHAPLVVEMFRRQVGIEVALFHSVAGPVTMVFAVLIQRSSRSALAPEIIS